MPMPSNQPPIDEPQRGLVRLDDEALFVIPNPRKPAVLPPWSRAHGSRDPVPVDEPRIAIRLHLRVRVQAPETNGELFGGRLCKRVERLLRVAGKDDVIPRPDRETRQHRRRRDPVCEVVRQPEVGHEAPASPGRFVPSPEPALPLPARDEDIAFARLPALSHWIRTRALSCERLAGIYLERLKLAAKRRVQPFGLDLSQKMVDIAQARLPELVVAVDDAQNLDKHFQGDSFDIICTHFITGFIPLRVITPLVRRKLVPGGYWSFVGGTTAGFPKLQKKANSRLIKLMFGGKGLAVDEVVTNPHDTAEVTTHLTENGFRIERVETFRPELHFENFDKFMEFGYHGGWLTPFLESLGLHKASRTVRTILNTVLFPMKDSHEIAIVLAQKED